MSRIASDYFYDLTPKASPHFAFSDLFEDEIFSSKQNQELNNSHNRININAADEIQINNDFPQIFSVSPKEKPKPLALNSKFSKSSDRFKMVVIKKSYSQQKPQISKSSPKFNIVRIPKNNQSNDKNIVSSESDMKNSTIPANSDQIEDNNNSHEIINLF